MATLRIYTPIIAEEQRLDLFCMSGVNGVSFEDIDAFTAAIPVDDREIDIRLNCAGGDVASGWAIVDKLRATGKKITATIEGQCASMATVILLAASARRGAKHASLLIHEPYYPEYTLASAYRAEDLEKLAGSLRGDTTQMLDFYVERTGADRAALEELMSREEFVGMDRAKELGFIHEILEPRSARVSREQASADWGKTKNHQIKNQMLKQTTNKGAVAKALALLAEAFGMSAPQSVGYELNTASGDTLTIDKPEGEDPAVGDPATPDGDHVMPDGTTIVVTDGVVVEILDAEDESTEGDELADAQARVAELEAEVTTLRKCAKTTDEARILNLVNIAGGESWLARAKSGYKSQGRTAPSMKPAAQAQPVERVSKVRKQLEALQKKNVTE